MGMLRLAAFFLAIAGMASAAFQFSSLSMTVSVREDGMVHVSEDIRLFMDDRTSIEIYDAGIAITNDITSWKVRTNVSDVRYHIDHSRANVTNIVIRPQPRDTCNTFLGTCFATLKMEYDASPIYEGSAQKPGTGLFSQQRTKPRTTDYELNSQVLSFETTQTGEIVLPENHVLSIKIPKDSVVSFVDPLPENLRESSFPLTGVETFSWRGRTTLASFEFKFKREQPLQEEVIDFFHSLQDRAKAFFFSLEGLALLFIIATALVSFYLLKKRE